MEKKKNVEKALAIWGLVLNGLFLLDLPFFNFVLLIILFLPGFGLIPLLFPFAAITIGICGICAHYHIKENSKTRYLVMNIINVALPIVVILTIVILLSTDVLVIRLM